MVAHPDRPERMPVKVAVVGARGRMGRALLAAASAEDSPCRLVAAVVRPRDAADGTATTVAGLRYSSDLEGALASCQVVIEFAGQSGLAELAARCALAGRALVSGSTGLELATQSALDAAAQRIAVLHAPNMSAGVAVLAELVERAVRALPGFAIEIDELHHALKKDSPSGTALRLAERAAAARGGAGAVALRSRREGEAVGEHTVALQGPGERLELTHRAQDRAIFAAGALRAAAWLHGRPAGRYTMADVLGMLDSPAPRK